MELSGMCNSCSHKHPATREQPHNVVSFFELFQRANFKMALAQTSSVWVYFLELQYLIIRFILVNFCLQITMGCFTNNKEVLIFRETALLVLLTGRRFLGVPQVPPDITSWVPLVEKHRLISHVRLVSIFWQSKWAVSWGERFHRFPLKEGHLDQSSFPGTGRKCHCVNVILGDNFQTKWAFWVQAVQKQTDVYSWGGGRKIILSKSRFEWTFYFPQRWFLRMTTAKLLKL